MHTKNILLNKPYLVFSCQKRKQCYDLQACYCQTQETQNLKTTALMRKG